MRIAAVSMAVTAALLTAACGGDDGESASQSASGAAASASAAFSSATAAVGSAVDSATAAAGSAAASATAAAGSAAASATASAGSAAASATAAAGSAVASATAAPSSGNNATLQLGTDAPVEVSTQSCTFLEGVGLSYAGQASGVQIVLTQAGQSATVALLGSTIGTDTAAKIETKADGTFTTTATVADKPVTITGHCDALVGKGGQ